MMEELEEMVSVAKGELQQLQAENRLFRHSIDQIQAENARLREALELLAKDISGICCECTEVKDIAREALKGGE